MLTWLRHSAKHVRSKDRAMNGRVYPKVCYPEMYILEGGYSQFYEQFPVSCYHSIVTYLD
jgi:M-phase inducer tyrosine phosphatase